LVSAIGIVTSESPKEFDEFARGRDLAGATVVLDSSGGSVNDSIALGRRFRNSRPRNHSRHQHPDPTSAQGNRAGVAPELTASRCACFLLLSGKSRYVPEAAHVAGASDMDGRSGDDAKAATYTAEDMMIVERDIGRLANTPSTWAAPAICCLFRSTCRRWEDLHELTQEELRLTNLVTTDLVAEILQSVLQTA